MIDAKNFPGRGQVAILRTRPETVLDDYYKLMRLCEYEENLPKANDTLLKINLSWHIWYPASSTAPWQLDGVIRALLRDGYARTQLAAVYDNNTAMDDAEGARNNRLKLVQDHYGIRDLFPSDTSIEWVEYQPKQPLAILDQFFTDGIFIPKAFIGKNILHLPTMKTDASVLVAGAMKNAFGGLLDEKRSRTRANLHDALVDVLQIQQDIHSGIFCVMDGTFAGEGAGPRTMRPYVKNTLLASSDPVALDAVAAQLMGVDPLRVRFIRHAHERGLGVGNPREIQILGDARLAQENWQFEHEQDTLASWGQKQIYQGAFKSLKEPLVDSPRLPLTAATAEVYFNWYWYPFVGAKRAEMMLNTAWGQKFLQYSEGLPFNPGASDKTRLTLLAAAGVAAVAALGLGAYYASRRKKS